MFFFENMASNCIRYVGTMEGVFVMGIDWVNLKAVAELNRVKLTKPMIKRLHIIENLLIKESVTNAKRS